MERLSTDSQGDHDGSGPVDEPARWRPEPASGPRSPAALPVDAPAPDSAGPGSLPPTFRITISFLGVLLICCATTATAMLFTKPRQDLAATAVETAPISGPLALRPDLMRLAEWPFTANGGFAVAQQQPPPASSAQSRPQAFAPTGARPDVGSMSSAELVVTDFYQRLDTNPAEAIALLHPLLCAGHHEELVRSWEATSSVRTLWVEARPGGSAEAEVEASYPDGERVVLRNLLTVDWRSTPRITSAELLTARKTRR